MKKIKVITRHAIVNYGSLFQSYATQYVLGCEGYDTQIIDYISNAETVVNRLRAFSTRHPSPLKRFVYCVVKLPDELIKDKVFAKFRKRLLRMTKRFVSLEELQKHCFGDDILCAGSDQLWGYMPNGKIDPAYFLDFGNENNRYFSYSASLGRKDFDSAYLGCLEAYLKKFSFLTIREQSGVELIQTHTSYPAKNVLDPTLLLPREKWYEFATPSRGQNRPYILLYQLRKNVLMDQYIKALAKKTGMQVIRVSTSVYDLIKFGRKKILQSPENVLSLFRDATCIVTDSFHATVLSLIFNKNFVDFLPPTTHERMTDLLKMVGLGSHIVEEVNEESLSIPLSPIDYAPINAHLEQLREEHLAYIFEKLKGLN